MDLKCAVPADSDPLTMESAMQTSESSTETQPSQSPSIWKSIPGYAIALACLLWVFHDVQVKELVESMKSMHWWWVVGAVILDTASYVCQGMRWSLLLHPIGRVSTVEATQAVYAGLYVNELLPMRVGEILRIYLASRKAQAQFSAVVPSVLVERFFDSVWLALAFGITVFAIPLPKYLIKSEEVLGFTALGATALFIYLVLAKRKPGPAAPDGVKRHWNPIRWISGFLEKMAGGIRDIGRSRFFYSSFGISLLLLLGQMLAFWFVMRAYGLQLSFWHGAAVFLIVHIGTLLPSAPSNVGTYQFFTVVGLTLFGISKPLASSFSVIVFLILTIPLWVIGLLVFMRLGLSLKKFRKEISSLTSD
jgi:uncharacterized protein (TIRG00374 family)